MFNLILKMKSSRFLRSNHDTIAYFWCDGHFINISVYGVWRGKGGVQVSRREFYTHIHLDYVKVKFLSHIKKIIINLIINY